MSAVPDHGVIQSIATRTQGGDLAGARAECERFLATVGDATRQAPVRFWLGVIERRSGALAAAAEQFERALAVERRDPQWLLQAGLTWFQLADIGRAEPLYREALQIEPRLALAHYNLGVLLQQKRDWPGAVQAFESALSLQPQIVEAWNNLANTLIEVGDRGRAEQCYRQAISVNPRLAHAHHGLGLLHAQRQQRPQARQAFETAIAHNPSLLDAWMDLAEIHHEDGNREAAIAAVEQVLARDPGHTTAQFKLAQFRGEQPAAAPPEMVERLYAGMAGTFDEHLVDRLGYRIPAQLVAAQGEWLAATARQLGRKPDVLDLGCGTGLLGIEIRPLAGSLIGVDLSASMLDRARQRGVYDELHQAELVVALDATPRRFEFIAATDVLIYLGDLGRVFDAVARHLAPMGRFAFSVESPQGMQGTFQLQPSGRFAHSLAYLRETAAAAGLVALDETPTTIRLENGQPIAGYLIIATPVDAVSR